jgi:hypothetical protein
MHFCLAHGTQKLCQRWRCCAVLEYCWHTIDFYKTTQFCYACRLACVNPLCINEFGLKTHEVQNSHKSDSPWQQPQSHHSHVIEK